ncbi:MAG: response regulator, partial [Alphaproteobacteria bacterium]|nr:response regulator [Alphaproteobacteria bacterium]
MDKSVPLPVSYDLSSLHVLIVDDDPMARRMAVETCKRYGAASYEVAANGVDAMLLLLINHARINVIACDWMMPGATGLELLAQVREMGLDCPFLMVTGKADRGAVMMAKKAGVSDFLLKPFRPVDLAEKLFNLSPTGRTPISLSDLNIGSPPVAKPVPVSEPKIAAPPVAKPVPVSEPKIAAPPV